MVLSPTCASLPVLCAMSEEVWKAKEAPASGFEALILEKDVNGNQRHIYVPNYFELWLGHKHSIAWFKGAVT